MRIDLLYRRLGDVPHEPLVRRGCLSRAQPIDGSAARRGSIEARRIPQRAPRSGTGDRRWRARGGAAAYVRDVASTFQPDLTDPACGVRNSGVDERRTS